LQDSRAKHRAVQEEEEEEEGEITYPMTSVSGESGSSPPSKCSSLESIRLLLPITLICAMGKNAKGDKKNQKEREEPLKSKRMDTEEDGTKSETKNQNPKQEHTIQMDPRTKALLLLIISNQILSKGFISEIL
jgi:hypothetical protein